MSKKSDMRVPKDPQSITSAAPLAHNLRTAMTIELATLPTYLYTYWSIKPRSDGGSVAGEQAAKAILSAAREFQMLPGIRRAALRDWLQRNGVRWVEDPSNDDPSFDRIKARQALATLEPLGITVEGLAATATRLQRQSDVLRAEADRLAETIVRSDGPEGLIADRDLLRAAHPDTAMRWLADGLMHVGGTVYRPRFRSLEPLFRRITSDEDLRATLAGCLIEAQKDEIRITREQK